MQAMMSAHTNQHCRPPVDEYATNVALDKLTELAIIATDGPQSPLLLHPVQHTATDGFSEVSSFYSSIHSYAKTPNSHPTLPKTEHSSFVVNNNNFHDSQNYQQSKDDLDLNNKFPLNNHSDLWTAWDSNAALALSAMAKSHLHQQKQGSSIAPTTPVKKRRKSTSSKALSTVGACKRPMNAFMLFAKRSRLEETQMHPGKDNRAISVILGDRWKHLCRDERQAFAMEAREMAEEYKKTNPDCWKRKRHHSASS